MKISKKTKNARREFFGRPQELPQRLLSDIMPGGVAITPGNTGLPPVVYTPPSPHKQGVKGKH